MKLRALLLTGLCVAAGHAHAGLFSDDEARSQLHQLELRTSRLEEAGKQQVDVNEQQAGISKQQAEINKQQTQSMLDLNAQLEMLNTELRKLRGQNEELTHRLQDAEKRQKDFYVDLDTRVRHFETIEAATPPAPPVVAAPETDEDGKAIKTDDVAAGNRAYEVAYGLFKAGKHQEAAKAFQGFLKKFPESVYVPNAHDALGSTYMALKDYKNALDSYQVLVNKYGFSHKVPDAMLNIAECQVELKAVATARKTLTRIISRYPGSEISIKAKQRLISLK